MEASGYTTLTLWSGDLTRQDVAGDEGNHVLDAIVRLADDGVWDVRGTGKLSVNSISELGQGRTFTKMGAGTLETSLSILGVTNINQGVLRGRIDGTVAVTVASGAAWQVISDSTPFPAPVTLHGFPDIPFFASLQKLEAGAAELSGPVTIENNPKISIGAGGKLTLSGGVTSVNNSGLALLGTGELVLSGQGAGSIAASILSGQLTIAHPGALGTGAVFAQDISGGFFIPVLAIADGVTFGNPITLRRGTIRGLGNSTISSNIALSGFVATFSNLDVPQASHTLRITGALTEEIAGSSLTKTGPGAVVLSGANTFSGGLTVAEGALANNGAITNSATQVIANSLLAGSGQFGDVNVQDSGRLAPGASPNAAVFSPATMAVEDLTFNAPTAALLIQLGGGAPGSGYDQVQVAGNATLAGSFMVSLANGFSLGMGDEFLVLDIAGARSGQFAALGEGSLVGNFGGKDLFITYAAGDGNDVALFTTGVGFTADFDNDDDVDGDDLAQWRGDFGENGLSDSDADGDSDGADFLAWQQQLGSPELAVSANAAVPEPATILLFIVATVGIRRIGGQMRQELVSE